MPRFLLGLFAVLLTAPVQAQDTVTVLQPALVSLKGPGAVYSLLIDGKTAEGRLVDLTRAARFRSHADKVATVSETGVVRAVADGRTTIAIEVGSRKLNVAVQIEGTAVPRTYHFENDITPLLNRFGCNSSGCHGNAEGQNGFKLSVFGFDPSFDYNALVKEARGRRIFRRGSGGQPVSGQGVGNDCPRRRRSRTARHGGV